MTASATVMNEAAKPKMRPLASTCGTAQHSKTISVSQKERTSEWLRRYLSGKRLQQRGEA
jgi:hypothetical protein